MSAARIVVQEGLQVRFFLTMFLFLVFSIVIKATLLC